MPGCVSDFINVVATGVWPVRMGSTFDVTTDGPRGRGYRS
jgi:hypothetical protein